MFFGLNNIHSNNEESNSRHQRNLESLLCDIFRRFIDLTSRPKSIERNHSPNNPIPSTSGLDCQFRKIEPNPVKSIQIPGLDVEYLGHVSAPSRRQKIEYPSRIEKIYEEDKIQKMYSCKSISQVDRETVSFSNPIFANSNNYRTA
jgi:hypothetical protein